MGFEENEISKNVNGGTEIAKRKLQQIIDSDLLKQFQIICSRPREIDQSKIRMFWSHDLPEDPEHDKMKTLFDEMHKLVFISDWQYQRYQLVKNINYDRKSIVIESGIEPSSQEVVDKKKLATNREKIKICYTSTPQRGLDTLVNVVNYLSKVNTDIHLDVFSSFKIYGWDDADKQYEPLYDFIRNHPNMTYHGFQSNKTVREYLETADIFAYPCQWLETSCRAMLEAMSAGVVCVHPNLGALPETSGGLNIMYHGDWSNKQQHANVFAGNLQAAINLVRSNNHIPMISFNKTYCDHRFNIDRIKQKWEVTLYDLLEQYKDADSRTNKQYFQYKV